MTVRIRNNEDRVRHNLPSAAFRPAARRMAKLALHRARRVANRSFIEEGVEELEAIRSDAPLFCEGHHSETAEFEPAAFTDYFGITFPTQPPRLHYGLHAFIKPEHQPA